MKKIIFFLMFAMFANIAVAETVTIKPPKKHQGFDYSKHQRKSRRIGFFNRTLNLNGCYGHYRRR
jgi:hypothetical protein